MHHSGSHISSRPRLSLPRLLAPRKSFTAEEVRQRLQVDGFDIDDARTAAVLDMAARTGLWSTNVPDRMAFELGRTASRLPTVIFWYRQGISVSEIGQRLSFFSGEWDADRAVDAAAALIAAALNRGGLEEAAA